MKPFPVGLFTLAFNIGPDRLRKLAVKEPVLVAIDEYETLPKSYIRLAAMHMPSVEDMTPEQRKRWNEIQDELREEKAAELRAEEMRKEYLGLGNRRQRRAIAAKNRKR